MGLPSRPKILVLISHYFPGTKSGGPVRTISNLVDILGDDFEFSVIALDHDYGDTIPYPDIQTGTWYPVGKAQVMYLRSHEQRPWKMRKILQSIKYDLVLLNGIYPQITLSFLILRRLGLIDPLPIIIAPRGHLERGALSIKPHKKRFFLKVAKLVGLFNNLYWNAASSSEEQDILHELGGKRVKMIQVVPNLTSLNHVKVIDVDVLKRRKSVGNLKIVFLSRVSRKKNLLYALEALRSISGIIEFDIYGPIEDSGYWDECVTIMRSLHQNLQVHHRGTLEPNTVIDVMRNYDLFFLPTLGENYGHAILEALIAGCPVLISDRTPWNSINEHGAGWALSLDEPNSFREVIQQMVNADDDVWRAYSECASAYAADYLANSSAVDDMRRFLTDLATRPHAGKKQINSSPST